ncbi:hypothetical protein Tco_1359265 [Tanacetum coccineum]
MMCSSSIPFSDVCVLSPERRIGVDAMVREESSMSLARPDEEEDVLAFSETCFSNLLLRSEIESSLESVGKMSSQLIFSSTNKVDVPLFLLHSCSFIKWLSRGILIDIENHKSIILMNASISVKSIGSTAPLKISCEMRNIRTACCTARVALLIPVESFFRRVAVSLLWGSKIDREFEKPL